MTEDKNLHWFANWKPIWIETDINEVKEYLQTWKKVVLNTYPQMIQVDGDHWIERDIIEWEGLINTPPKTLALKICLKGEFTESQLEQQRKYTERYET